MRKSGQQTFSIRPGYKANKKSDGTLKRRNYITILVAVLVLAAAIWFRRDPPPVAARVTVAWLRGDTNSPNAKASFRIYNESDREIILNWAIVETNTSAGWRTVEKSQPEHPRVIGAGKWKDLSITAPSGRWRLKVLYATENRGPALWEGKVETAIRNRSLNALGSVGVFTGEDSVTAEVTE
jgi:hypothetical protein